MSSTLVYQEFSLSQTHSSSSSSLCLKLNNTSKDVTKCMWTAIESLSGYPKQESVKEYVHPSAKRSSMSERSLEMCTESLCSETGVFFTDSYLTFSTTTTTAAATTTATICNNSNNNNNKKPRRQHFDDDSNYSFPPPLTTMRGSNSLQVRPYREDGRLVIEAIPSPLSHGSCLKAERSDGRLRMSMVRQIEEVEEEEIEVAIEEGNFGNTNNNFNKIDDVEEKEEEEVEGRELKLVGEDNNSQTKSQFFTTRADSVLPSKLIEDNKTNGIIKVELGGKMVKGEHNELSQRGKMGNSTSCSRCKEGGRGNMNMRRLNNWEPFWVAT